MLEMISGLIRSIMYILLLELFSLRKRTLLKNWQSIIMIVILTIVQVVFSTDKYPNLKNLLPILVMIICCEIKCGKYCLNKIRTIFALVMEVYVTSFLCSFVIGCICGVYENVVGRLSVSYNKVIVILGLRTLIIVLIWWKYEWLQKHIQNLVRYVMVILGACILFFEQLFRMAYMEDSDGALKSILLLVYFSMIYTALMNLQHRHLTADNQRILDDNQRMSQEIHRSRDVIDVVSRVVATEDTIDPKLRQELADFCKSEKQEMFDPDLAASLIGDTGMDLLNALLRDKLCQCRQQEISFEVMIPEMIDTYVSDIGIGEAELLRVINDLVKNAVTAINKTDGEVREILLILAVGPSDCLELCVYDSGVPFPDFILERFGERGNTTTGTGNGLADTVNTLRTYDASIEIEAIDPGTDIYTKCVRICFDGKNEIHI